MSPSCRNIAINLINIIGIIIDIAPITEGINREKKSLLSSFLTSNSSSWSYGAVMVKKKYWNMAYVETPTDNHITSFVIYDIKIENKKNRLIEKLEKAGFTKLSFMLCIAIRIDDFIKKYIEIERILEWTNNILFVFWKIMIDIAKRLKDVQNANLSISFFTV